MSHATSARSSPLIQPTTVSRSGHPTVAGSCSIRPKKDPIHLYQKAASGAGNEELLLEDRVQKWPESWSPDGRFILYLAAGPTSPPNANDLSDSAPIGDKKPYPFVQSPSFMEDPTASSLQTDTGSHTRPMNRDDSEAGRHAIPGAGWRVPGLDVGWQRSRWRRDGKEIFYVSEKQMLAAAVTATGTNFDVGVVRPLFDLPTLPTEQGRALYDVSPDGQRFLVNTIEEQTGIAPITVVVNWPSLLKK